jgi:hypothetical protein
MAQLNVHAQSVGVFALSPDQLCIASCGYNWSNCFMRIMLLETSEELAVLADNLPAVRGHFRALLRQRACADVECRVVARRQVDCGGRH